MSKKISKPIAKSYETKQKIIKAHEPYLKYLHMKNVVNVPK
jgi:hypothetical protein